MMKLRVLIDTNILLSGLIWNGNESHLLELSADGDICLLIPKLVLDEARRVLALKFKDHAHLLDEALELLDHLILDEPSLKSMEVASSVLRDPNDVDILASIIESKPDYAVTGDKDLLTAEVRAMFPTSKCIDFLRQLDLERGEE